MGAEVVEHHPDAARIRVVIDELAHLFNELDLDSFLDYVDMPPANQWFTDQENVRRAGWPVRVVGSSDRSRFRREGVAGVCMSFLVVSSKQTTGRSLSYYTSFSGLTVYHVTVEGTLDSTV